MKIRFKYIISCMIGVGIGIAVHAQAPQEKQESLQLTLKEAQEHAIVNNKNIRNAGLAVSQAQKKVWETISAGLPQVNATLDYQNMMGFKMSLMNFDIALEPTSTFQAQVTQLLFSGS
ncbi:MAG: hypothetical protein LBV39_01255, partial [Bacteroidales bacterium]|nr:hypothetical protein [Bacteroidales bacterium]